MASLPGVFNNQEFTDTGVPLAGGRIYTYVQGTTTQKDAYTDIGGTIPHTYTSDGAGGLYIGLNARGELPAPLYLAAGAYDIALKRADGSTVWTRRADGIGNDLASSNGAAQVGGAAQVVSSISALRSLLKTSASKSALVTGYYAAGDGGGGVYYYDSTDTTSADNGGTIIVATDGGRWKLASTKALSVKQFGAKGDGSDDTAAMTAARNYIAAQANSQRLVFPAGTYAYTTSPNWAIADAQIIAEGEVRLKCTGTGHAVILDAGSGVGVGCYNVTFGKFIVQGATGGLDGVYVRGVHHSKIEAKVVGVGTGRAGLRVEFAVCTKFGITVSVNEEGWATGSAAPFYGIVLTQRNTGEATSYCTFENAVLEGVTIGSYLDYAMGNEFVSGTQEGCSSYGTQLTANALNNKYLGVDFESNIEDILCGGYTNAFIECDTGKIVHFQSASKYNTLNGGSHSAITIDASAGRNLICNVRYNKKNDGSVLTDNGGYTRLVDNMNYGTGLNHDAVPSKFTITVGASPFTYTNTTGNDVIVVAFGGTVSAFTFANQGGSTAIPFGGSYVVPSGASLSVTYSVAPTMIGFTK
jgi:hypothetical protein